MTDSVESWVVSTVSIFVATTFNITIESGLFYSKYQWIHVAAYYLMMHTLPRSLLVSEQLYCLFYIVRSTFSVKHSVIVLPMPRSEENNRLPILTNIYLAFKTFQMTLDI